MQQSALLGGLFIGVLSALPFVSIANCCCAWFVAGGLLAAYLQHQSEPGPGLAPAQGAKVGLLAGVVGAFVWLFTTMLLQVVMSPFQDRLLDQLRSSVDAMPPETRVWVESMIGSANAPFQRAVGFLFQLLAGTVFGMIGGLLGAAYFRRDVPPALGGPPPPPPLP